MSGLHPQPPPSPQPDVISVNLPKIVGTPLQMPSGAMANWLDHRLHLQHGPIDLIVTAEGEPAMVALAYARAADRFSGLLDELVSELPLLRAPAEKDNPAKFEGLVARRMAAAIQPYLPRYSNADFITPMAAVAGSVADEILQLMGAELDRASVNNGGDIALYLGNGAHFDVGIGDERDMNLSDFALATTAGGRGKLPLYGRIRLDEHDRIGGIATSGWRGRSQSLGIADSVTVLAQTAAAADVAATLIANAITISSPAILRVPATDLYPDSDLNERLVTVEVGVLTAEEVSGALGNGGALARQMCDDGLINGVHARLQGHSIVVNA